VADCSCDACKADCLNKPGWFMPSDIPRLARLLGMPEAQLAREKLAIDYWMSATRPTFVLAPPNTRVKPGGVYPIEPHGRCAFLTDNGLCSIHAAKPTECRETLHTDTEHVARRRKRRITQAWRARQKYLVELVGRDPEMPAPTLLDLVSLSQ
jgi:Fe-S-cluster containining protein